MFQNELQGLGIDPYQVGELIPMDFQSHDPQLMARRCGGCGGFRCGGCGGFRCGGCGGFRCGGFRCGGFRCGGFGCFGFSCFGFGFGFGCGGCGGCGGCAGFNCVGVVVI